MQIPEFKKRGNQPIPRYLSPIKLAARAEKAWRDAGHENVAFWTEPYTGNIRSNLVNGLPPKGEA